MVINQACLSIDARVFELWWRSYQQLIYSLCVIKSCTVLFIEFFVRNVRNFNQLISSRIWLITVLLWDIFPVPEESQNYFLGIALTILNVFTASSATNGAQDKNFQLIFHRLLFLCWSRSQSSPNTQINLCQICLNNPSFC